MKSRSFNPDKLAPKPPKKPASSSSAPTAQYTTVQYFTVERDLVDQRIDNALFKRLKNIPKSHVYQILRKGEVRVNRKRVKPDYKLQFNDEVRLPPLNLAPTQEITIPEHWKKKLQAAVLWENENVLVLNKPAGLPVHSGSNHRYGVIDILRSIYGKETFLELVHRLDIETSGCLLLAKNRASLTDLQQQLVDKQIQKTYLTLVKGIWPEQKLSVSAPLLNSKQQNMLVKVDPQGKAALTKFEILSSRHNTSLLHAFPLTGRTHQIRVHTAHAGHPIAGDPRYGDYAWNHSLRTQGLQRIFLHASQLEFKLASESTAIKVSAPLDPELENFLAGLGYKYKKLA